ncbi:MAG TPA: hypothetical protein HA343_06810 [Methanomassiliicoccales archaeon]|nr:hypothetical protein [Methanomassiliicoccales archaeon]
MPDPERLGRMFTVLSEQVPKLPDSITKVLYGTQEGTKFGESVAALYKTRGTRG